MVGSRRSSLNQGLSLKSQYEAALHDLTDLVDTAQDKMAADQKMTVASVIEVQMLLDKHKVRGVVKVRISLKQSIVVYIEMNDFFLFFLNTGVFPGSGMPYDPYSNILH